MIYAIIAAVAAWRVVLFTVAWFGSILLPFVPRFPYADVYLIPSGLPSWIWSFGNFDGVHYLTIAKMGYSAQFTQVFFPLYPLAVRLFAVLFFKNIVISGLLLSNLFFIAAIIMLNKLLVIDGFKKNIWWILMFMLLFPFSFYFGSLYTESLFLFLVITSFFAARRKHWFFAALLGAFASATRLVGIFLLPALLIEWFAQRNTTKNSVFQLLLLGLIPIGLFIYMFYLNRVFGDPLYFWHVQPVFGAQRSGSTFIIPIQVLWRYAKIVTTISYTSYDFWVAMWEMISFLGALFLLGVAYIKKIRLSYLVFSLLCIVVPSLTGTLSSMPRYILVAFPLCIVLGSIDNQIFRFGLLVISSMLLVVFTILFTSGRWVA